MSRIVPPVALRDEPPIERVQRCLLHIALALLVVFATAWCYQIHVALGLTVTFLAKHVLVAILASGLRLPIREIKS
jgi:hypothetical protein